MQSAINWNVFGPKALKLLTALNHMGGDERGGYCICPRNNGAAPDAEHSTDCVMARSLIAEASAPGPGKQEVQS